MKPFNEQYVIETIVSRLDKLENKLDNVRLDIVALKIKSGIWGFAAGLIPAIGVALMWLIGNT